MGRRLLTLLATALLTNAAEAQVTRFAAATGSDANLCTRTSPCRTVQRAVNLAPAGGEVQLLDSGEYPGAVSITKAIVITAEGVSASLVGNGIVVNAPGGSVVLRGVVIRALSGSSHYGVLVQAATSVQIENCVIERFHQSGVESAFAKLTVTDSILRFNRVFGLRASNATVARSQILNNAWGAGGAGAQLANSAIVGSTVSSNSIGVWVVSGSVAVEGTTISDSAPGVFVSVGATLNIDDSLVTRNTVGISVSVGDPMTQFGKAYISNSIVTGNQLGVTGNSPLPNPPRVFTYGNNVINGVSGSPLSVLTPN